MKRRAATGGSRGGLLGTRRTGLVLYSILVVLPAVVFGGLHWLQLLRDHEARTAAVPELASSAVARTVGGIQDRLRSLLDEENARPFYHYQRDYWRDGTTDEMAFLPSPVASGPAPPGILSWFVFDHLDYPDADVRIFDGGHTASAEWIEERERMRALVDERLLHGRVEYRVRKTEDRIEKVAVRAAAVNLSPHRDTSCLRQDVAELDDIKLEVQVSDFLLRLFHDDDGVPRLIAERFVTIPEYPGVHSACFESIQSRTVLEQGFFLDPTWVFQEAPALVAERVLQSGQRLLLAGEPRPSAEEDVVVVEEDLIERLGIEADTEEVEALGRIAVITSLSDLAERFRVQTFGFWRVAGVMIVSLVIGMFLLVRSVRSSLEQARRTENFVAAVTHELRTPIAAVKMYGEMLQDGWARDAAQRQDYLTRIVRETDRLDTLVGRMLQKRRLAGEEPRVVSADLTEVVRSQIPELSLKEGAQADDVRFKLNTGLPPVRLVPEAVHGILANLVENARKYAKGSAAPIEVRTGLRRGRVVLEVSDRGPGIPEAERSRIFEAFYRIGDERTRNARGTGLGLHLVQLDARAMKAKVQVEPRSGGGSTFRITFRK